MCRTYYTALITSNLPSKSDQNHFLNSFFALFTFPGALMWLEAITIHYSHCKGLWNLTSFSQCSQGIEILLGMIDCKYKERHNTPLINAILQSRLLTDVFIVSLYFFHSVTSLLLHVNKYLLRKKTERMPILKGIYGEMKALYIYMRWQAWLGRCLI